MPITDHPDYAAFVAAVVAAPADDLPRLLFADWLDEHNCGERAEFIRVQCELATIKIDMCNFPESPLCRYPIENLHQHCCACRTLNINERHVWTDCRYHVLSRRGQKLLGMAHESKCNNYVEWGRPATAHYRDGDGIVATYRRGFVESIECPAELWLRHADAILAAAPVTTVTISDFANLNWWFPSSNGNRLILSAGGFQYECKRAKYGCWYGAGEPRPLPGTVPHVILMNEWPSVTTWNLPPAPVTVEVWGAGGMDDMGWGPHGGAGGAY